MLFFAATGTMFQFASGVGFTRTGLGGNCQGLNFYQAGLLGSVDFCYLLDCQNGFLGGAIKPCGDPAVLVDNLLLDCPTPPLLPATTGTGTGTGNTQTP